MTPNDRKSLLAFLCSIEEMISLQEKYSKAKQSGEAGKARDLQIKYSQQRDKVKASLPECKAIISADQQNLF